MKPFADVCVAFLNAIIAYNKYSNHYTNREPKHGDHNVVKD